MLIGLGGGAASSMGSGQGNEDLDFASVQRGNPEMQRRCQEVIDRCWALGDANPIVSIHDVGAGGLSNAVARGRSRQRSRRRARAARHSQCGPGMSPMEIWCNEAQERYVLGIERGLPREFEAIASVNAVPYAVLGTAHRGGRASRLRRRHCCNNQPVDLPIDVLLGKPPRMHRDAQTASVACRLTGLPALPCVEA